jgi:hypothetical protein
MAKDTEQRDDVLCVLQIRAQLQGSISTKPRSVIQLLYAPRHCLYSSFNERFRSLAALVPVLCPFSIFETTDEEALVVICSYTLLLMNNLDLFTLLPPTTPCSFIPSWAESCAISTSIEGSQPLLHQELITGADGPFCAGGREFREAPAFHKRRRTLYLKGFQPDSIGYDMRENSSSFRNDQARLGRGGCGKFIRGRQWLRTTRGLAVLGPERAQSASLLTILIGGKTPYLLERVRNKTDHFRLLGEWYVNSRSFRDNRYRALIILATWTG